jgi:hypothetical protein
MGAANDTRIMISLHSLKGDEEVDKKTVYDRGGHEFLDSTKIWF